MRRTLLDIKNSRIPTALGYCSTDTRLVAVLNEAQERLLTKGLWWGCFGKFRICATNGCITLPPQIATIETAAISGHRIPVHDMWFEFLENGYGTRNASCTDENSTSSCGCGGSGSCGMGEANYRGHFPTFKDIQGSGKQLNFICDLATDVGKEVLAMGYDDNSNWIRTLQGGVMADGEVVAFAQGGGTNSTNNFSCVTDIQLPDDMDGQSWLYEYTVSTAGKRMIGKYEYWETRPHYARYYLPSIRTSTATDGSCDQTAVEIIGKMEFIPVKNDTDYLIISNIPALKAMCVGIVQSEKVPDPVEKNKIMAAAYAEALRELDSELLHYRGDGTTTGISVVGASVYGNNPVETLL